MHPTDAQNMVGPEAKTEARPFLRSLEAACCLVEESRSLDRDSTRALEFLSNYGPFANSQLSSRCRAALEYANQNLSGDGLTLDENTSPLNLFDRRLTARSELRAALDLHYDERSEEAQWHFLAVEGLDPEGPFTDIAYAVQFVQQGKLSSALQRLEQAVSRWEFCAELHVHLGLLYRRLTTRSAAASDGDREAAATARHRAAMAADAEFSRAIDLDSEYAFAYAARGSVRMILADFMQTPAFDEVNADLEMANALEPAMPAAAINKIGLLRRTDEHSAAEALTLKLLGEPALNRTDRLYILRGFAERLRFEKRFDEAIEIYNRGLELRDSDTYLLCGLARTLIESRPARNEEAIALCDRALTIEPVSVAARLTKAIALTNSGEKDEAIAILHKLVYEDLGDVMKGQVSSRLASLLAESGNVAEAYLILSRSPEAARQHPAARKNLSRWSDELLAHIPHELEAIASRTAEAEALTQGDEKRLRLLASLPFQLGGAARMFLARNLVRTRRAGGALALLQRWPTWAQDNDYKELIRQAKAEHRQVGRREARATVGIQARFVGDDGSMKIVGCQQLEEFLAHLMQTASLPIAQVISDARSAGSPIGGMSPIFLKAATGVGKTVVTPLYVFCEHIKQIARRNRLQFVEGARVIVVEPRIAIAENEAVHLNREFEEYVNSRDLQGLPPEVYGCITSTTGRRNGSAPVVFVTTGVFESMARSIGQDQGLDSVFDRVIIDEAHVTLPNNPGIEIAIALCRESGVVVDFMSATVDDEGLEDMLGTRVIDATQYQRFDVEWVNTHAPLDECLSGLVKTYLLERENLSSALFAHDKQSPPAERAVGMLVVVNSHQAENSDTLRVVRRLEQLKEVEPLASRLEIRRLASPILRDPDLSQEFSRWQAALDDRAMAGEAPRYVIVTTNVVEMGVTFPSLDFVVTMDSEIATEESTDGSTVRRIPISVSALAQRAGRAGRKRPGMCFITREDALLDSDRRRLSDLSSEELAFAKSCPEKLIPPLTKSTPTQLAYLAFKHRQFNLRRWRLLEFLPSAIRDRPAFEQRLKAEMDELVRRGIASRSGLTREGEELSRLPPGIDQQLGLLLLRASQNLKVPAAVIAATGDTMLSDLIQRHRALAETGDRGGRRGRGVRFAVEESVGSMVGPGGELIPLGADPVEATLNLRSGHYSSISDLMHQGLSEVQACQIARLLGRGFTVVSKEELAGPEPDDPTLKRGWSALIQSLGNRIHFAKELVELDPDSDLISMYQLMRALVTEFPESLGAKDAPSYLRRGAHARMRDELRAAELEPVPLVALAQKALEVAKDKRACGAQALRKAAVPQFDLDDWRAACESALLRSMRMSSVDFSDVDLHSLMNALELSRGHSGTGFYRSRLYESLKKEGTSLTRDRFEELCAHVLRPAMLLAGSKLSNLSEQFPLELPVLSETSRRDILALLRRRPYYGQELVLRKDGYGNYVARRVSDRSSIELNVARTSVVLFGDYVHVIARLRIHKGIDQELSLSAGNITALRRELSGDEAHAQASRLGISLDRETRI